MEVPESHLDLLERPLFAAFATVRASGAPQAHPMWFLWDRDTQTIKMTHTKTRHNYEFVQRDRRVAILIIDPDAPYRYLQVRGVVEGIEDDPQGDFYQVLSLRYRGQRTELRDAPVRVILTIRPTAFVARSIPGR